MSEQTIRNITRDHKLARAQAKSETAMVAARVPVMDIRVFEGVISRLGVDQKSTALRAFVRHPSGFLTADAELAVAVGAMRRELSAIGSNLNQIARRLNDPRLLPEARKLSRREAEVLRATHAAVTQSRDHLAVLWGKKARRRDAAFRAILGETLVGDTCPEDAHGG
ncbi:plasmid mobilization relaxosome protein MobC [Roseinatronobacter alkalisoli]|uniref:Plasmid mobilization relaxosome protein MobC n=1 Tax=Roseinatronobacter alkalisoli TaxID=3028235 RepID=A0ABT5TFH9_9RHOB|nr:plasmid mobilization relaxosome protein MobC [Roseinatronobacter sp. HJB301]MDD7973882.1 plasmid mobilization relaxosome protein MobC [Roseinatronobacter sp. HJB301]